MWVIPKIEHLKPTIYGWVVSYPDNLELGKYSDIGFGCYIQAECCVKIGRYTQIGAYTAIYSASSINGLYAPVEIGENVKIGAHSLVMPGVKIGDGAIVGAYSYVDKDIGENQVYIPNKGKGYVRSSGQDSSSRRGEWVDRSGDFGIPPAAECRML